MNATSDEQVRGRSDVLIIGAGPAGSAAGIALARAGIDVVAVDRARFPRDKTCGDAVSGGSLHVLDELGVGDAVRRLAHAVVDRAGAEFPDGTRIEREYDPPGIIVPRLAFDDCLRRAFEAAGGRLLQGLHVTALDRDGGVVRGAKGDGFDWQAKVVIACDGHGSVAAEALGRGTQRGRHLGLARTAYLKGVRFPFGERTADHLFEPDLPYGYAWVFPDVEGISNVGVYITQDAYREQGQSLATLLEAFLARHPDRFADAEQIGRARTWSLPLAPLRTRASAPGLLVAGDAGYFIDPLSGEGIWQALYSGMLAGRVTADALRGAGQLTARHRARYDLGCARHIGLPSFAKAGVQSAMRFLVANDLYKLAPVRAGLRAGYRGNVLEISRSND